MPAAMKRYLGWNITGQVAYVGSWKQTLQLRITSAPGSNPNRTVMVLVLAQSQWNGGGIFEPAWPVVTDSKGNTYTLVAETSIFHGVPPRELGAYNDQHYTSMQLWSTYQSGDAYGLDVDDFIQALVTPRMPAGGSPKARMLMLAVEFEGLFNELPYDGVATMAEAVDIAGTNYPDSPEDWQLPGGITTSGSNTLIIGGWGLMHPSTTNPHLPPFQFQPDFRVADPVNWALIQGTSSIQSPPNDVPMVMGTLYNLSPPYGALAAVASHWLTCQALQTAYPGNYVLPGRTLSRRHKHIGVFAGFRAPDDLEVQMTGAGQMLPTIIVPHVDMQGAGTMVGTLSTGFEATLKGAGKLYGTLSTFFDIDLLFTRLGHIIGVIKAVNTHRGGDIATRADNLRDAYDSRDVLADQTYRDLQGHQRNCDALVKQLQRRGEETVVTMLDDWQPLPQKTLRVAMAALIRQMVRADKTVKTTTPAINYLPDNSSVGNPNWVFSLKDSHGRLLENTLHEKLTAECTSDAQLHGNAGGESFQIQAEHAQGDGLAFDWPQGSGTGLSIRLVDEGDGDRLPGTSLLSNGGFDNWNRNKPTSIPVEIVDWEIAIGSVSADNGGGTLRRSLVADAYKTDPAYGYGMTRALRITAGTINENTEIRFVFARGALQPLTVYSVNFWAFTDATTTAGVLEVALRDGDFDPLTGLDNVVNDASGTANALVLPITSIPSSYKAFSADFRTPKKLTGTEYLRIKITTALSYPDSIWIDSMTFAAMTPLYAQGPWVQGCAGNVPAIKGDRVYFYPDTDRAGQWQEWFERLFRMREMGMILPSRSDGAHTISEALIL
jgi:hypothetical protein